RARTRPEARLPAATTRASWIICRARSWIQAVADAPDGAQVLGPARVGLDLLPQPSHVDGHRAGVDGRLVAPDAGHQLVAGEAVAGVRGEEPEQLELLRGELDDVALAPRFASGPVEPGPSQGHRL